MGKLEGRIAIITGASRGIGRSIALAYAAEGAHVVVNYLQAQNRAKEVVGTIERMGGKAVAVQADVAEAEQARTLVQTGLDSFGQLDILVNNAGGGANVPFSDISIEAWDAMIAKNLRSAFLCTRFALPSMLKQQFGRIINISSQLAIKGGLELAHYCAAKGGLIAFTKALALELAKTGITVNAIAPGRIRTEEAPGKARVSEEWLRRKLAEIPLGRFGNVEEVAPTAVLIASSPDGDFYTGQTFHPNGGDVMP